MPRDIKVAARVFGDRLSELVATSGRGWFEIAIGPNYMKVLLHRGLPGVRVQDPETFCFISRLDRPFDWDNFRIGDVLPPKTGATPWKMDTGAVANVFAPDGGISYWVRRYGAERGLWQEE